MRKLLVSLLTLGLCACNLQNQEKQDSDDKTIEVVVHRGANALAPENTLPSADSALVHGAKWIEVDVRTTIDGVMYNLHDEDLSRTTNGEGNITEKTSDYIETLECGSWFGPEYAGLKVPTIKFMLDGLKGRANVFFDVKNCSIEELVKLVRESGFSENSFFWFGKEEMLKEFITFAPEMKIKVNANDIDRLNYWMTICHPSIVETHVESITPEFLDYCHNKGIKVMVAAQGENEEDYRKALECGADMINLDKPEIFEKIQHNSTKEDNRPSFLCNAISDGKTLNTVVIQNAIDSISENGGGILRFKAGTYLTGMLVMRSGVELWLDEGATLLGSTNPYDYDAPKGVGKRGDEDVHCGLIVADGAKDISICGKGTIDGQGLGLALAIDSLHHIGERIDPSYNKRRMRPTTRPKLFFLNNSVGITIDGLTLKNSSGWGLSVDNSSIINISNLKVINRGYWNNDGIDLNDCKHAKITNCDINSADDGICLKSDNAESCCDDITIANCRIASSASAIKFGSSSYGGFKNVNISNISVYDTFRSALALETVDGGIIENINVSGIKAVNTGNPIFICLGARHDDRPGICQNITIKDVEVEVPFGRPDENYDLRGPEVNYFHNPWPSSIAGLPERYIKNVILENITLTYPGRATKGMAYVGLYRVKEVNEAEKEYPEFSMYGELPSWGFYLRHIDGLSMKNVTMKLADKDFRPAIVLDDVKNYTFENMTYPNDKPLDNQVFDADKK